MNSWRQLWVVVVGYSITSMSCSSSSGSSGGAASPTPSLGPFMEVGGAIEQTTNTNSATHDHIVANAHVGLYVPSTSGWKKATLPTGASDGAIGATYGYYRLSIPRTISGDNGGAPIFIMASDEQGKFTLVAPVSGETITTQVTITVNINQVTTAASVMHCPYGIYPPQRGSYCWQDPTNGSTTDAAAVLEAAISNAIDAKPTIDNDASNLPRFIDDLIGQEMVRNELKRQAAVQGTDTAIFDSPNTIGDTSATLPIVPQPTNPYVAASATPTGASSSPQATSSACTCTCDNGQKCGNGVNCSDGSICAKPAECPKCS